MTDITVASASPHWNSTSQRQPSTIGVVFASACAPLFFSNFPPCERRRCVDDIAGTGGVGQFKPSGQRGQLLSWLRCNAAVTPLKRGETPSLYLFRLQRRAGRFWPPLRQGSHVSRLQDYVCASFQRQNDDGSCGGEDVHASREGDKNMEQWAGLQRGPKFIFMGVFLGASSPEPSHAPYIFQILTAGI